MLFDSQTEARRFPVGKCTVDLGRKAGSHCTCIILNSYRNKHICDFFAFSLTWDPMGANISLREKIHQVGRYNVLKVLLGNQWQKMKQWSRKSI